MLEALKLALILGTGYFMGSVVVVHFFLWDMMRLFSTDPELLTIAVVGGRVAYAGVIFTGVAMVTNSFFQGIGLSGLSLFLSLCRQFVFLIPALLIMPRIWGAIGVWGAFPALDAGGGALSILLLWGQCRRLGLLRCEARRLRLARLRRAGGGA